MDKEIIIPTLKDSENGKYEKFNDSESSVVLKHFKCIKNEIQECFFNLKCLMKSHDKIIDEILPFCRLEALEKLNITDFESMPIFNDSSEIDELSSLKIGKISNLNEKTLPKKTIKIFQNLTYGHLEAIKISLIPWPKLKKDFCDPSSKFLSIKSPNQSKSEKILSQFFIRYPYITVSKEIKTILENITAEEFQAVKDVINVSAHFRWIICKSVIILSTPIKTVTKVQKSECKKDETTTKFEPSLTNLKICRKWVLQDEFNKSGICK
uniref:Uncharacterized protein n=1 Tax=Panagrolaimus sp. PS1159 TaxID=55785 RepID=A0AC35FR01_9BILA